VDLEDVDCHPRGRRREVQPGCHDQGLLVVRVRPGRVGGHVVPVLAMGRRVVVVVLLLFLGVAVRMGVRFVAAGIGPSTVGRLVGVGAGEEVPVAEAGSSPVGVTEAAELQAEQRERHQPRAGGEARQRPGSARSNVARHRLGA
jgi:hypothetical protein